MTERGSVQFGDTLIEYTVLRSKRRKKTIAITLDPHDGILVAAPMEATPDQLGGVLRKRAGWIVRNANAAVFHPAPKQLVNGESVPYLGRQVRLFVERGDVKRTLVHFAHWRLTVTLPRALPFETARDAVARALHRWYQERARARLQARVAHWGPVLGCTPGVVLIRNQRQRWASCAPDGTLRFNHRAVQLDAGLMDYVVVHELMHLLVRPHSPEFWERLRQIMPDYRLRRQRLREIGTLTTVI